MLRHNRCIKISFISFLLLCLDATVRTEQSNGSQQSYNSLSRGKGATNPISEKLGLMQMRNGIEGSIAGGVKSLQPNSQDDPRGKESSLSREIYRWHESNRKFDSTTNITTSTKESHRKRGLKKHSELLSTLKKRPKLLNMRKSLMATAKNVESKRSADSSTEEKTLGNGSTRHSADRTIRQAFVVQDLTPIITALNSPPCSFVNVTWLWPAFWSLWG